MQIDGSTVVLIGILVRILLGALFLVFWLRDRSAVWFIWWSATFFLGDVAALFYLLSRFAFLSSPFAFEVAILIAAVPAVGRARARSRAASPFGCRYWWRRRSGCLPASSQASSRLRATRFSYRRSCCRRWPPCRESSSGEAARKGCRRDGRSFFSSRRSPSSSAAGSLSSEWPRFRSARSRCNQVGWVRSV